MRFFLNCQDALPNTKLSLSTVDWSNHAREDQIRGQIGKNAKTSNLNSKITVVQYLERPVPTHLFQLHRNRQRMNLAAKLDSIG